MALTKKSIIFTTSKGSLIYKSKEEKHIWSVDNSVIFLSTENQDIPAHILDEEFELGIFAWLVCRGYREACINGMVKNIDLSIFNRPIQNTPKRIVSLCPSNTDIVGWFKCEKKLVAVDNGSDWKNLDPNIVRLGPEMFIDIDLLKQSNPDLVLASLSVPGMERTIMNLLQMNIPMMVFAPQTIGEIQENMISISQMLNKESMLFPWDDMATLFTETLENIPPISIYLEWWPKPLYTPGRLCWSNEIFKYAGGFNIFGNETVQSLKVKYS